MRTLDKSFLKRLLKEDAEFKNIYDLHKSCEKKASKLNKKNFLTAKEEVEEKRLKKMKLMQKDRMEEIVLRYKNKQDAGISSQNR